MSDILVRDRLRVASGLLSKLLDGLEVLKGRVCTSMSRNGWDFRRKELEWESGARCWLVGSVRVHKAVMGRKDNL